MSLHYLTEYDDELVKDYTCLTDSQLRDGAGAGQPAHRFRAESRRVIEAALDAGCTPDSFYLEECWLEDYAVIIERVERDFPQAKIYIDTAEGFRRRTGYSITRGALALFWRQRELELDELLVGTRRIVILEDITNYANIAGIFRAACAFGVDAVLLSPSCHDPLFRRALRLSGGASFSIPWLRLEGDASWARHVFRICESRVLRVRPWHFALTAMNWVLLSFNRVKSSP